MSDKLPVITDDLIEIHDPEVDPQQLMAEIRRRIQQRRAELGYEQRTFPRFGAALACPEPPEDIPYPPDLYHHLRQANDLYAQVETGPLLAPSPATRVPVLGRLWRLVRSQAHGLVLFYVNRAVGHQANVNRHLVSVVNQLAVQNEEQQRAIMALQAEVERLRRQETGGREKVAGE
ncbi:MAG: hypothetical protein L0332_19455 [Chloroflexi bacterium]|nr:hypothetical protein [Chloroflexota bacterium]MCI0574713.1 hypothetical protein [Chloroflexota bacterium]MCI0647394.1 hypothetical protein [Chloroflexota bacterium]MCI0728873.1 hypothetical protein [Chloroflexota bacterium]